MPTYRAERRNVYERSNDGSESIFALAASDAAAETIASALNLTASPVAYIESAQLQGVDRYGRKNVTIWDSPGVGGEDVPLFAGKPVTAEQRKVA